MSWNTPHQPYPPQSQYDYNAPPRRPDSPGGGYAPPPSNYPASPADAQWNQSSGNQYPPDPRYQQRPQQYEPRGPPPPHGRQPSYDQAPPQNAPPYDSRYQDNRTPPPDPRQQRYPAANPPPDPRYRAPSPHGPQLRQQNSTDPWGGPQVHDPRLPPNDPRAQVQRNPASPSNQGYTQQRQPPPNQTTADPRYPPTFNSQDQRYAAGHDSRNAPSNQTTADPRYPPRDLPQSEQRFASGNPHNTDPRYPPSNQPYTDQRNPPTNQHQTDPRYPPTNQPPHDSRYPAANQPPNDPRYTPTNQLPADSRYPPANQPDSRYPPANQPPNDPRYTPTSQLPADSRYPPTNVPPQDPRYPPPNQSTTDPRYHPTNQAPTDSRYPARNQSPADQRYPPGNQPPVDSRYPPANQPSADPRYPPANQPPTDPRYPPANQPPTDPRYPPTHQPPADSRYPPGNQPPDSRYPPANQPPADPRYPPANQPPADPRYPPANQPPADPRYPPRTTSPSYSRYPPENQPPADPRYTPANQPPPDSRYPPTNQPTPGDTRHSAGQLHVDARYPAQNTPQVDTPYPATGNAPPNQRPIAQRQPPAAAAAARPAAQARPPVDINTIKNQMNAWIRQQKRKLRDILVEHDKDSDGQLNPYELSLLLKSMNIQHLETADIQRLINQIDKTSDGKISLYEFGTFLGYHINQGNETLEQAIFHKIDKFLRNSGISLKDYFARYDGNRKGSLTFNEFRSMIQSMELNIDAIDIQDLFAKFDENRDGDVQLMEFQKAFDDVIKNVQEKDNHNKQTIRQKFRNYRPSDIFRIQTDSQSNQPAVTVQEFRSVLEYQNCGLKHEEVDRLVEELDPQRRGVIQLQSLSQFFDPNKFQTPRTETSQAPAPVQSGGHWAKQWFDQVKDYAARNRKSVQESFLVFCSDSSGRMTHEQFTEALTIMTVDINQANIDRLAAELRRGDRVAIDDLVAVMEGRNANLVNQMVADIKYYLENNRKNVEEVFRVDSLGWIYRNDLVMGLKQIGININPESVREFLVFLNPEIERFNITSPMEQKVSREVLLKHLQLKKPEPINRQLSMHKVEENLKRGIFRQIAEYARRNSLNLERDVFMRYDRNGSNRVQVQSFQQILEELTERRVDPGQLRLIIEQFNPNNQPEVQYQPFISRIEEGILDLSFIERILTQIRTQVNSRGINLNQIFQAADTPNTGYMTFEEVQNVLNKHQISVQKEELQRLLQKIEHNDEGKISYQDLISRIFSHSSGTGSNPPSARQSNPAFNWQTGQVPAKTYAAPPARTGAHWCEKYFQLLRDHLSSSQKSLVDLFTQADIDRSNSISADELRNMFNRLNIRIPEPDLRRLVQELDSNRDGRISLTEFQRVLGQETTTENRWDKVRLDQLKDTIKRSGRNLFDIFLSADRDQNGSLSYTEFSNALRQIDPNLTQNDIQAMARAMDVDRSGSIMYAEFMNKLDVSEIEGLNKRASDYIKQQRFDLKSEFARYNTYNDECIPIQTFLDVLNRFNLPMSSNEVMRLVLENKPHRTRDNRLSYIDFLERLKLLEVDVLEKVKKHWESRRITPEQVFNIYDTSASRQLSYQQLFEALSHAGAPITRTELDRLVLELPKSREGLISYEPLLYRMGINPVGASAKPIYERLRRDIEVKRLNFYEICERADRFLQGSLNRQQLTQALQDAGLNYSPADIALIFDELDVKRTGTISYQELTKKINPNLPTVSNETSLDGIVSKLSRSLNHQQRDIESIVRAFDNVNSGTIMRRELKYALEATRALNSEETEILLDNIPSAAGGKLNYRALVEMVNQGGGSLSVSYGKVKDQVAVRGLDLLAILELQDPSRYGNITVDQFRTALNTIDANLTEGEIQNVINDLDVNMTGYIKYFDFIYKVQTSKAPQSEQPSVAMSQRSGRFQMPINVPTVQIPVWARHHFSQLQNIFKQSGSSVRDMFHTFDVDKNNALELDEFKRAIKSFGLHISDEDLAKLADELDYNRDGYISLTEFEQLFPEIGETQQKIAQLLDHLRRNMHNTSMDITTSFTMQDPGRTGKVSPENFQAVLQELSFFNMVEMRELTQHFSTSDGRIDYNNFLESLKSDKITIINSKVKNYLLQSGRSLAEAFAPHDQGDHCIHPREFRSILQSLQLPLLPEELTSLIHENNLYRTADNRLSFKDLIDRVGIREQVIPPKPTPEKVFLRIKENCQNQQTLLKSCGSYDYEGDMHLTRANFTAAMASCGSALTSEEVDTIWPLIKKLQDGRINIQHFVSLVFGTNKELDQVYFQVKQAFDNRRMNYYEYLRSFDRDNDQALTYQELQQAFGNIGVRLLEQDYRMIFETLDKQHSGRIAISNIITGLNAQKLEAQVNLEWASNLLTQIRQSLHDNRVRDPQAFFMQYGIRQDGAMQKQSFQRAMQQLGIPVSSIEVQRLQNELAIPDSDYIKFNDFRFALQNITRAPERFSGIKFRVLNNQEIEHCYKCLDYISQCIAKDRKTPQTVVRQCDANDTGQVEFNEFRRLIVEDLKIPSDERVFNDLFLLLDGGSGQIPALRLVDALSGVRVAQILPPGVQAMAMTGLSTGRGWNQQNLRPKDVIQEFRQYVTMRRLNLSGVFRQQTGEVSAEEFILAIKATRFNLTPQDQATLLNQVSTNQQHTTVSMDTFFQLYNQQPQSTMFTQEPVQQATQSRNNHLRPPTNPNQRRPPQGSQSPQRPMNDEELLQSMSRELIRLGIPVEELYANYDADNDGIMTREEFHLACQAYRISFPTPQLNRVFDLIDTNQNQSVSLNEFALKVPGPQLSQQQRAQRITLDSQLTEEITRVFKFFDKDGDGVITQNEIVAAFKAYGMVPNPQQINDIMRRMDTNRNGQIEFQEFQIVMEDILKKEILEQEDTMADMRKKFIEADVQNLGYLTPNQVLGVLQAMGMRITPAELQPLLDHADVNRDGKIDIDEFMLVVSGSDPNVYYDPQAMAVVFNIRKTRRISPFDFIKLSGTMPQHFVPSYLLENHRMGRALPSSCITPLIEVGGLNFRDVLQSAAPNRDGVLTNLKQCPVLAGGQIIMRLATGVSIPDKNSPTRHGIVKRIVRIGFFDGLRQELVGNSCYLEANWGANLEDEWKFEKQNDKDYNILTFNIGQGADLSKLFLFFEFNVVVVQENSMMELSCGHAKIAADKISLTRNWEIPIEGGSPINPISIKQEDIRTYRSGFRHLFKMVGLNKVRSMLQCRYIPAMNLPIAELTQIESMPNISIIQKKGLQICKLYRESVAITLADMIKGNFEIPNVANTFMTQFQKVMNCPDIWLKLLDYWNSPEFYTSLGMQRTEETLRTYLNTLINRLYSVTKAVEFEFDEASQTKFSTGIRNQRGELESKRAELVWKALKSSADSKLDAYDYQPFDISEIASNQMLDLDTMFNVKLMSKYKPIATATGVRQFASTGNIPAARTNQPFRFTSQAINQQGIPRNVQENIQALSGGSPP